MKAQKEALEKTAHYLEDVSNRKSYFASPALSFFPLQMKNLKNQSPIWCYSKKKTLKEEHYDH
ncbi:hypothetical protein RU97_GL001708 [Enterococcus canis]|uniref:Uncharacterized protein n=1 Tax=Enterococcus canis TaxID=214095 RepID=A0A1L8REU9_9ENTE|nr:hypothetical protein RU97_GL001708 [Enterococcus canis]